MRTMSISGWFQALREGRRHTVQVRGKGSGRGKGGGHDAYNASQLDGAVLYT